MMRVCPLSHGGFEADHHHRLVVVARVIAGCDLRWERNRLRGEIRLDPAIYRRAISHGEAVLERRSHKGAMPRTESGGYGLAREIVLPTSTIPFLGGDLACPNQTEAYLRVLYSDFKKIEYTYVDAGPAKARARVDTVGDPS